MLASVGQNAAQNALQSQMSNITISATASNRHLPAVITLTLCVAFLAHGPIVQFDHYHEFAATSTWLGIPHASDVLSNLGFLAVAIWGMFKLWPVRHHPSLEDGLQGHYVLLLGLLLTAFGSTFYHWSPDNARLVFDRLPIALICAGILASVRAETIGLQHNTFYTASICIVAVLSVWWWRVTDLQGHGDLRPYLLLQVLPMILVPLWQFQSQAPRADKLTYGAAACVYVLAKLAEISDHRIWDISGCISGHTLKHLLASLAVGIII